MLVYMHQCFTRNRGCVCVGVSVAMLYKLVGCVCVVVYVAMLYKQGAMCTSWCFSSDVVQARWLCVFVYML